MEINSKVPIIMKCSRNLVSNSQFHRYEPKKVVGLLFGTVENKNIYYLAINKMNQLPLYSN